MKNNMTPTPTSLQQTNVIYKFKCPLPHSQAVEYVGLTQTSLSRRLTMHGQNGSIYQHFTDSHNKKPNREELTNNTTIIARAPDRYRLAIKEALLIQKYAPTINKQFYNFTNILRLHNPRNIKLPNPPTFFVPTLPTPSILTQDPSPNLLDSSVRPSSENPCFSFSIPPYSPHPLSCLQETLPSISQGSDVFPTKDF